MDSISATFGNAPAKLIASFTIPGEPASKARARFTKRGSKTVAYTPEKTKTAENAVATAYLQQVKRRENDKDKAFAVHAHFYNGTSQRRDVDNMMKLILDGLNKWAYPDDSQVTEVVGRKTWVGPHGDPRTEVRIYCIGEVDRMTKPCAHCGEQFRTYASQSNTAKYCSDECRKEVRRIKRQNRTRTCDHCGDKFLVHGVTHGTRFCSRECWADDGRVNVECSSCGVTFSKQKCHLRDQNYCTNECMVAARNKCRRSRMAGTCQVCGGGTTRKEYARCNSCKLKGAEPNGKPQLSD